MRWWIVAGLIRWVIHGLGHGVNLGITWLVGMDYRGINWRLLGRWLEVNMARLLVAWSLTTRSELMAR